MYVDSPFDNETDLYSSFVAKLPFISPPTSGHVGGLIGTATKDKDGLLSRKSAPYTIQFSNYDIVLTFDNIFAFQPFMIACYFNGISSTYIVNPSTYNWTSYFEARYLGRLDIEIYAKIGDNRIFIKTSGTTNGELGIQPLYINRGRFKSVDYGTTPNDFTKIDIIKM